MLVRWKKYEVVMCLLFLGIKQGVVLKNLSHVSLFFWFQQHIYIAVLIKVSMLIKMVQECENQHKMKRPMLRGGRSWAVVDDDDDEVAKFISSKQALFRSSWIPGFKLVVIQDTPTDGTLCSKAPHSPCMWIVVMRTTVGIVVVSTYLDTSWNEVLFSISK